MIQKATAANTHRRATPERGLTHTGSRYFNAFIFNPLKVLDTTMLRLASTFLFFIIHEGLGFIGVQQKRQRKVREKARSGKRIPVI